MNARFRGQRRHGLTLMELIIVLMILVAVAGILIPILPSMLTRTHVATHTSNVVELSKLLMTYQGMYSTFPDQWDSMVDSSGAQIAYLAGGVLDPIPPPANGQAGGLLTAQAPTAAEITALNAAGIKSIHNQLTYAVGATDWAGNNFDPTFANYSGLPTAPTLITTSTKLTYLSPSNTLWNNPTNGFLQQNYPAWSPTANYVVLGIGPRCTMIGKMAITAPIHFSDTQDANPEFSYGRFVAIFKVSDPSAPGGINMAQLVGVAAIHAVGINNLDSEFQNFYQIQNGGS